MTTLRYVIVFLEYNLAFVVSLMLGSHQAIVTLLGAHVALFGVRFAKWHDTVLNGGQSAVRCEQIVTV